MTTRWASSATTARVDRHVAWLDLEPTIADLYASILSKIKHSQEGRLGRREPLDEIGKFAIAGNGKVIPR
jgi:hypothetical protein